MPRQLKAKFVLKKVLRMRSINMRLIKCGCSLEDYLKSSENFPSSGQLELS